MASYLDAGSIVALAAGLALWEEYLLMSSTTVGLLAALGPNAFGAAIGALVGGRLGDLFGRKRIYQYDLLVYALGTLLIVFSFNLPMLLIGTFIVGVAVGADVPTSLALIGEFSPSKARGKLMGLSQVAWSLGPIVVYVLAFALTSYGVLGSRIVFAHLFVVAIVTWALRRATAPPTACSNCSDSNPEKKGTPHHVAFDRAPCPGRAVHPGAGGLLRARSLLAALRAPGQRDGGGAAQRRHRGREEGARGHSSRCSPRAATSRRRCARSTRRAIRARVRQHGQDLQARGLRLVAARRARAPGARDVAGDLQHASPASTAWSRRACTWWCPSATRCRQAAARGRGGVHQAPARTRTSPAQIAQIKALVVNSIEGLPYDNVTVALFPAEGLPARARRPAAPAAAPLHAGAAQRDALDLPLLAGGRRRRARARRRRPAVVAARRPADAGRRQRRARPCRTGCGAAQGCPGAPLQAAQMQAALARAMSRDERACVEAAAPALRRAGRRSRSDDAGAPASAVAAPRSRSTCSPRAPDGRGRARLGRAGPGARRGSRCRREARRLRMPGRRGAVRARAAAVDRRPRLAAARAALGEPFLQALLAQPDVPSVAQRARRRCRASIGAEQVGAAAAGRRRRGAAGVAAARRSLACGVGTRCSRRRSPLPIAPALAQSLVARPRRWPAPRSEDPT